LKASEIMEDNTNYIPDQERRNLMNWILVGSAAGTVGGLAVPYLSFFVPPTSSSAGGAISAKDALGHDISATAYLASHAAGDRSLVQGLSGDATYLIIDENSAAIKDFALNAICTHLGCVVPWSAADNKFMCPCHGSQYDSDGAVVRGPAPLPLALAHASVDNDKVMLSPWTELDFRTNEKAWWN
jgi:cytochrome b6-f complex iron-sulfur subunit